MAEMGALSLSELGQERHLTSPELQTRADQNKWSKHRLQFLAKDGQDEVGFLSFDVDQAENQLVLYELWVASSHRRRGYGRGLLELAEKVARSRGVALLLICPGQLIPEVSTETLRAWYMRCGYEPWATDPDVLAKVVT